MITASAVIDQAAMHAIDCSSSRLDYARLFSLLALTTAKGVAKVSGSYTEH